MSREGFMAPLIDPPHPMPQVLAVVRPAEDSAPGCDKTEKIAAGLIGWERAGTLGAVVTGFQQYGRW